MTTMTDRCPTCDREGCPYFGTAPSVAFVLGEDAADPELLALADCLAHAVDWRARALAAEAELAGATAAICDVSDTIRRAIDGDEGGMRAPYHGPLASAVRYPSIASDLRRLDEVLTIGSPRAAAMRDSAAKWAKVAPLIERLRPASTTPQIELLGRIADLLAATEPTP